jgi:hypothetical protein
LELEVVNRSLNHPSDIIIMPEVRDQKFNMLYSLFGLKMKDVHAAECVGSVPYCRRGGAVDSHFIKEGRKVSGLDFITLLSGKARCTQWVMKFHLPNSSESNPNVFLT